MSSQEILVRELESTAITIEWPISRVPEERLLTEPPHSEHKNSERGFKRFFGRWPAYRLFYHLAHYEEFYALPAMRYWLGDPHPDVDIMFPDFAFERSRWENEIKKEPDVEALSRRFRSLREEQIEVTRTIPSDMWKEKKMCTALGTVSAEVVVTKTVEHTLVYGKTILRKALYWDRDLVWLDSQGS